MSRQVNQSLSVVVLLFISAVVGFMVYNDHQKKQNDLVKKAKSKLLFHLDSTLDASNDNDRKKLIGEVVKVEIFNGTRAKGQQTVVVARDKTKNWVIRKPVVTPGDNTEVDHLLRDIIKAKADRAVLSWKEKDKKPTKLLAKYGLEKSKHKLTFTFRKLSYTVWLGSKNSFNSKFYLYMPGYRKVVMVDSSLKDTLNKKLFDLRRKEIFTQNTGSIKSLSVTRKRNQMVFEKRKVSLHTPMVKMQKNKGHSHSHGHSHAPKKIVKTETRWYMTLPLRAWASKTDIDSLLTSLKYLKASKFVSEDVKKDAKKFGLDKPRITIEVTLQNGKRLALNLSTKKVKNKMKVYAAAAAGGPIAEISKHIIKELEKDEFEYRETKVVRFKAANVFGFRYGVPGKMYSVIKMAGNQQIWKIYNPSPQRVDKNKVRELLNQLTIIKAARFIKETATAKDLKAHGLDKPKRTYIIYGRSSKSVMETLYVGNKTKDGYMVTNKAKQKIVLVKSKAIEKLPTADWQIIPGGKAPKSKTPKRKAAPRKAAPRKAAPRKAAPRKAPTARGAKTRTTPPAPARRAGPWIVPRRRVPAPTRRTAPAPAKPVAPPKRVVAPPKRAAAPAPKRVIAPAPAKPVAPAPAPAPKPVAPAPAPAPKPVAPAPAPAPKRVVAPAPAKPVAPAPVIRRAAPVKRAASQPTKR